ncbi:MAG: nicotinate-nucleotide adenylyltransferase [Candidatus Cloacimonetes bacterium]|nr:nicotinate-nucleotide adenylyltransferase [Candidatus Cloacimonadota bacterium]MBS3767664.1 nicotinate-nucleotide adenylyltransferase [Candidatus Cloacimonadota bacterium]
MKHEKIGILGGTFNPIHFGHLKIAQFCKDELSLDKILFVPAGLPPHKNPSEAYHHRAQMVQLAIENREDYLLAELEKPKQEDPQKYNYTYETLSKVSEKYPESKVYFIIGEDNVPEIKNWYKYKKLFNLAQFVVLSRKSDKKEFSDISYLDELIFLDMPKIDIASAKIREKLKNNKKIKNLVPLKVWNYINLHKLYKK